MIISLYLSIKEDDRRSDFYLIQQVAKELGYALDVNGSNSYVMKVLREYSEDTFDMGLSRPLEAYGVLHRGILSIAK